MRSIDPARTAVLLVGYQRDYFDPEGTLFGVVEESHRVSGTLANTVSLLERVRHTRVTVVSTPIVFSQSYSEIENPVGILSTIKEVEAFKAGSPGAETIEEVRAFGDRIVELPGKRGFNAFSNTGVDSVLRERGITHVAIAGCVTSICVNATAMHASEQGFEVTVLSD